MAPAEPRRARCGHGPHGPHPKEAKHARPRAAVRCVLRKPANRGAARDQLNVHGKEQPGQLRSCNRTTICAAGPRKARSARLLSIGTAGHILPNPRGDAARTAAACAAARLPPRLAAVPANVSMSFSRSCCASCSGLFVRRGMLQSLGVASSPIRFTQGLMSGRPRKSRRTPAIGEHEVIRQLPGQLLVSGARYTGSAETSEQLLRRRCAAGRATAFWQTQSQLRGFSPSSPRA